MTILPEFASIAAFVQFCQDEEQTTFSHQDMASLNFRTHSGIASIRSQLEEAGLTLVRREFIKRTRGFTTSNNDRWYGAGSCATHGGSGFDDR